MQSAYDRRVLARIVDTLKGDRRGSSILEHVHGPKKALCSPFQRWVKRGECERIFAQLVGVEGVPDRLFIDKSRILVSRTFGGKKWGAWLMVSGLHPCTN